MIQGVGDEEPKDVLPVVFEDAHFIAINKPPGLLVHRTKLNSDEKRFALQLVRDQVGYRVYPVHRLDKPTSGILLFGKDPESARRVSELIQAHQFAKTYVGLVRGWVSEQDTIDYALKEIRDKTTDSKAQKDKPAQEAITAYSLLAKTELPYGVGRYATARYSLVEINPLTGRKNQIRRHFKHIFHPIIGDRKFGDRDHNAFFRTHFDAPRLMLAATKLVFEHPFTSETVTIQAKSHFPAVVLACFSSEHALNTT